MLLQRPVCGQTIARDSASRAALLERGRTLLQHGRPQAAREQARQALGGMSSGPTHQLQAAAYLLLAQAHWANHHERRTEGYAQSALTAGREAGDSAITAAACDLLGKVHYRRGNMNRALRWRRRHLALSRHLKDTAQLITGLLNTGRVQQSIGGLRAAEACYQELLPLLYQHNQAERLPLVLTNLGLVASQDGRPAEALGWYEQARPLWKQQDDARGLAKCHLNEGLAYTALEDDTAALAAYRAALKRFQELKDTVGVIRAYNNLGMLQLDMDRLKPARTHIQKAMQWLPEAATMQQYERMLLLHAMGQIELHSEAVERAEAHFQQAHALSQQLGISYWTANTLLSLAEVHHQRRAHPQTQALARQALSTLQNLQAPDLVIEVLDVLHRSYAHEGEHLAAYECLRRQQDLSDSVASHKQQEHIQAAQARFHFLEKSRGFQMRRDSLEAEKQLLQARAQIQRRYVAGMLVLAIILIGALIQLARSHRRKDQALTTIQEQKSKLHQQARTLEQVYGQLKNHNERLEREVRERTCELERRNTQLEQYAFMNSHKVRAPLVRIMSLVHLMQEEDIGKDEEETYKAHLLASADELDAVIKQIAHQLRAP